MEATELALDRSAGPIAAPACIDAHRSARPARWPAALHGFWIAVAVTTLAALVSLHSIEQQALLLVERALVRHTGLSASVARLGLTPLPAVALHRVQLGRILTIERVLLRLGRRADRGLSIVAVELQRPALSVQLADGRLPGQLLEHLRSRSQPGPAALVRGSTRADPMWSVPVEIHHGRLTLQVRTSGGNELTIETRGIHFAPASSERLLLGPVRVAIDGEPLVRLAAAALDLDRHAGWRPQRGAAMDGQLLREQRALLAVQVARLRRTETGSLLLEARARPVGRQSNRGSIHAELEWANGPWADPRVDPDHGPVRARVQLSDVELDSLVPLLEGRLLSTAGTRLGGLITVEGRDRRYRTSARLRVKRLRLVDARIAPRAVGPFDAELDLDATANLRRGSRVDVERFVLRSGGVSLSLAGRVQGGDRPLQVDLRASVPPTPCQQLLAAIPAGFAPRLEGMAMTGTVGLRAGLRLDTAALDRTGVSLVLSPLRCRVTADPPAADVRKLARPLTVSVIGASGGREPWRLSPENRHYRRLGQISPFIRAAFLAAEDARFFSHRGFDVVQLRRAFIENLRQGRLVRGASTVSQQLIKNAFLDHQRTLSRKFQEMLLTWRMEQLLPKKRILELYLNLVEMGPGVHGVEQACRRYFGHGADQATPLEAAHLAAMTPSPRPLAARFAQGDPGPAWVQKLQQVLRLMRRNGSLSAAAHARWSAARLTLARHRPD